MDVLNSPEYESYSDVQSATLMHLYRRLGHQYFETHQDGQRPGFSNHSDG